MSNETAKSKTAAATTVLEAAPTAATADVATARSVLLKLPSRPSEAQADAMLSALVEATRLDGVVPMNNPVALLDSLIRRLDEETTKQLNEVMHAEEFLTLEGEWRGLQRLVKETDTNKTLYVEVMHATKDELREDFTFAASYDTSRLWELVYRERYDQNGGKPYSAFVCGFDFANTKPDLALLKSFAQVGAAAQAPFILSASHELFGINSFADMKQADDLKNAFNTIEFAEWNEFRKNPDSRFLALTMPRFLARLPYGSQTLPARGLKYEEAPTDNRGRLEKMAHENLCWSPSPYAFGGVLAKAFRQTNWTTAIMGESRGRLNGGMVGDLPQYTFYNAGGSAEIYPPTETTIPGDLEYALAEMGLLPLSYKLESTEAQFLGGKTMFTPSGIPGTDNYRNDFVASMLPNVLPAARISHYMKAIGRRFHGTFASKDDLYTKLNDWLANYKGHGKLDEKGKTEHPLQDYAITVTEGAMPGEYNVDLKLKFWHMVYTINSEVSMVAKIDPE